MNAVGRRVNRVVVYGGQGKWTDDGLQLFVPLAHYKGPFRVYMDGDSVKADSGYITRIGVPREFYAASTLGAVGSDTKCAYCSIEYQTTGHDTVNFGLALRDEDEGDGGIPVESRNFHVIVLADISPSGVVTQRHFGDIEYIHFDRCVSCA